MDLSEGIDSVDMIKRERDESIHLCFSSPCRDSDDPEARCHMCPGDLPLCPILE